MGCVIADAELVLFVDREISMSVLSMLHATNIWRRAGETREEQVNRKRNELRGASKLTRQCSWWKMATERILEVSLSSRPSRLGTGRSLSSTTMKPRPAAQNVSTGFAFLLARLMKGRTRNEFLPSKISTWRWSFGESVVQCERFHGSADLYFHDIRLVQPKL